MKTFLTTPGPRIAPSVLAADFACLRDHILAVTAGPDAPTDVLHWDIMDGHFVPNLSIGVPIVQRCRAVTDAFFDVHLMITDPARYAEPFVAAGADLISFHAEVIDDPRRVIDAIRSAGVKHGRACGVGMVVNPHTDLTRVQPVLADLDLVLLMSVFPGFGGQSFMPSVLDKARTLRPMLSPRQKLEIDGGINRQTIAIAAAAGVDTFVAGTAVFAAPDPRQAVRDLLALAKSNSLRI